MKINTALTILAMITCPSLSFATASPELTQEVEQQITSIREALSGPESPSSCRAPTADGDSWIFRNIWIRLTTPVGFTIPGLAAFSVVPTFELLVQRTLPEGWQVYQPPQKSVAFEQRLD